MKPPVGVSGDDGNVEPDDILDVSVIPQTAYVAANAADERLGSETVILAMASLLGVVDAFVITSGRNARHVRSLADDIEARVKAGGGPSPSAIEGLKEGTWVLIDYGDVVIHVFDEETRSFYDLEHLWSRAPRIDLQPLSAVSSA